MTLEEFVEVLKSDADLFRDYYMQSRNESKEEDKQYWPLEMDEGEWIEQFFAYMS